MKHFIYFAYICLMALCGCTYAVKHGNQTLGEQGTSMIVWAIIAVCVILLLTIFIKALSSKANDSFALSMPPGSIRGIIALSVVVLFVLVALLMYLDDSPNTETAKLGQQILTILGTLVTAISAFYFGVKATEVGSNLTMKAMYGLSNPDEKFDNDQSENGDEPNSNADQNDSEGHNDFQTLSADDQAKIIIDFIVKKGEKLRSQHPEITGFSVGHREVNEKPTNETALIIQIAEKNNDLKKINNPLPKAVDHQGYVITTDIQEYSETHATNITLDSSTSRENDTSFGTIGLPVTKDNQTFLLGCYHVYFNKELGNGITKVGHSNKKLVSPGFSKDPNNNLVGELVEGTLDEWLDYGVCKPEDLSKISMTSTVAQSLNKAPRLVRAHEGRFITFYGAGSEKNITGSLKSIFTSQVIKYIINNKEEQKLLHGLIQLEKPCSPGDSGSLVVNSTDQVIGIVIASDNRSTYILSAETIESKTNYKIKYTES